MLKLSLIGKWCEGKASRIQISQTLSVSKYLFDLGERNKKKYLPILKEKLFNKLTYSSFHKKKNWNYNVHPTNKELIGHRF